MANVASLLDSAPAVTLVEQRVGEVDLERPEVLRPRPASRRAIAQRRAFVIVQSMRMTAALTVAGMASSAHLWRVAVVAVVWLLVQLPPSKVSSRSALSATGSLRRTAGLVGVLLVVDVVSGRTAAGRWDLGTLCALAVIGAVSALGVRPPAVRRWLGLDAARRVLVVGKQRDVEALLSELEDDKDSTVVGACLTGRTTLARTINGVPVTDGLAAIGRLVRQLSACTVLVLPDAGLRGPDLMRLQWQLEGSGADLSLMTPLMDTKPSRLQPMNGGSRLSFVVSTHRPGTLATRTKAAVERLAAIVLLVLLFPVLAVCAIAVKLDSRGPVLFTQRRVGHHGRQFQMLKIRTMAIDAERQVASLHSQNEGTGYLFKIRRDPRVTRVGRLLRGLSLDEIPQLVNVIKGDMALIGPRPALPSEVERYDAQARRRLAVRPGITGLWQVSGRSDLSMEQSVRLDIDYVDNWSPGRDTRIAWSTVRAVLSRRGAY